MTKDARDFLMPNEALVRFVRRYPDFTSPSFQFYVNNFLGSSRVMLMAPDSVGGYVFLLAAAWNSADCGLPNDDEKLAVLSRLGSRWGDECGKEIRACLFEYEGKMYSRRLLCVRKAQIERREKAKKAGIKSGQARRGKSPQCELPLNDTTHENELGSELAREPTYEPVAEPYGEHDAEHGGQHQTNTESEFEPESQSPDEKRTGSPVGGSFKAQDRNLRPAFIIDGFPISGALWGRIRKKAGNDPFDAGRVLYRSHNAFLAHKRNGRDPSGFNLVAWIMAGFKESENGIPYAFKACKAEEEDPAGVRRWIEREVLKLNVRSIAVQQKAGPEKLSLDSIRRAVPNLETGSSERVR